MTRADKSRFCGECKKYVHDLSSMSEKDARALLRSRPTEGLCVRFLYDEHGKVFFQPEGGAEKLVAAGRLNRVKRFAVAAVAMAMPFSLAACMGAPIPPREPLMGAIAPEPLEQVDPIEEPNDPQEPTEPIDVIDHDKPALEMATPPGVEPR